MKIRLFEGSTVSEKIVGHFRITVQRRKNIITVSVKELDYSDIYTRSYLICVTEERTGRLVTIIANGSSGSLENFFRMPDLLDEVMASIEYQLKGVLSNELSD